MTIETTYAKTKDAGDGTTVAFAYNYPVLAEGNLVVKLVDNSSGDETLQVLNTDYTVSTTPAESVTVTFASAPASTVSVTIDQNIPYTQVIDLTAYGKFPSEEVETGLDTLTMLAQQLRVSANRSIQINPSLVDFTGSNQITSNISDRISKVIGFSDTGNALQLYDNPASAEANAETYAAEALASKNAAATSESNASTYATTAQTAASAAEDARDAIYDIYNVPETFGAVGDGTTDDTEALQDWLDAGGMSVLPKGKTYRITGPLYYDSNLLLFMRGFILHDYTGGVQGALVGRNYIDDDGDYQENVRVYFQGGGIKFSTMASPSRKGMIFSFTNNLYVEGVGTYGGNDMGSYNIHLRSVNDAVFVGGGVKSGDSTGEDGIHLGRDCSNISFNGVWIESGDDAFSITQEGGGTAYTVENIRITNCSFKTKGFSSLKLYVDTDSATAGSKIRDIYISNTFMGMHDADMNQGGNMTIYCDSDSYVDAVSHVYIDNVETDSSTSNNIGGNSNLVKNASHVHIRGFNATNTNGRAIQFYNAYDCSMDGYDIHNPQVGATLATGTIDTITWQSGNTVQAHFSDSPDLTALAAESNTQILISGAANASNNGRFSITAVDNTAKTVSYSVDGNTRGSATDDETGLSASGVAAKYGLESIGIAGGARIKIGKGIVDNPGTSAVRVSQYSGTSATNIEIDGMTISNAKNTYGLDIAGMKNSKVKNVLGYNCSCRSLVNESNSSVNENNVYDTIEEDVSGDTHTRTSFVIGRASSVQRRLNGTNTSRIVGEVTIASGSSTTTFTAALVGTTGTNAYTRAFASANMDVRDVTILPYSDLKNANYVRVTLSSRTYTFNLDADPGATAVIGFILDASNIALN